MKPHTILKTFKGSQTGHDHHEFVAGTVADLSRDLAAIAVKQGWAEPVIDTVLLESVAAPIKGLPHPIPEGDVSEVGEIDHPIDEEKSIAHAPENKMKKPVKGRK